MLRRHGLGVLGLASVYLFFAWPILSLDGLIFGSDTVTFVYPLRAFSFRWVNAGIVPLWNPHIYAGTPNLAGVQSALFYPGNFPFLLVEAAAALNLTVLMHLAGHLLGAYALLAFWGVGPAGGVLGAGLATFNLYQTSHLYAGHLTPQAVMMWAPWALILVELLFRERWRRPAAVGLGVVLSFQFFAGHPQYLYYSLLLYGGFFVVRLAAASKIERLRALAAGGGGGLIFLGLSLVQLLPTLEFVRYVNRAQRTDLEYLGVDALTPRHLLLFLFPGVFGDHVNEQFLLSGGHWEVVASIGIIGTVLGLWAGFGREQVIPRRTLLVFALVSIPMSMGSNFPGFVTVFPLVPGLSLFRALGRILWWWSFAMSLLAGFALDDLLAGRRVAHQRLAWAGLLVAGLLAAGTGAIGIDRELYQQLPGRAQVIIGGMLFDLEPGEDGAQIYRTYHGLFWEAFVELAVSLVVLTGLLLLQRGRMPRWPLYLVLPACLGSVWYHGHDFLRREPLYALYQQRELVDFVHRDPRPGRVLAQWDYQALNLGMIWDYENVGGSNDPLILEHFAQFVNRVEGTPPERVRDSVVITRPGPELSRVNVRYILYPEGAVRPTVDLRLRFRSRGAAVYENLQVRPRVEVASPGPASGTNPTYAAVTPNRVRIFRDGGGTSGQALLLRDIWYPGWVVKQGEATTPVTDHDGLVRKFDAPGDSQMSEVIFEPDAYRVGGFLHLLTILALTVAICIHLVHSREP